MPQFGIFAYPGRNSTIPFVVQIQSSRLASVPGRVVMALPLQSASRVRHGHLTPYLTVLGRAVYANSFDLSTIPARRLGTALLILPEPDQDLVARALDEMVSRA